MHVSGDYDAGTVHASRHDMTGLEVLTMVNPNDYT